MEMLVFVSLSWLNWDSIRWELVLLCVEKISKPKLKVEEAMYSGLMMHADE